MADVKKTVEIALKVVGIDTSKIKTISTAFTKVSISVNKATDSITKFKKILDSVKAPASLNKVVSSLKDINSIKAPNLVKIANGFDKLSKMQAPPSISKFTTDLQKFSTIKLTNINSLATGFKKFTSLDINSVVSKIRSLNTSLKELEKRGSITAFKNFASDVNKMKSAFSGASSAMNNLANKMKDTGNAAQSSGIKLKTFGDKVRTVLTFRIISEALVNLKLAIGAGINAIIDYDQALKDLQAITGATTLEVAQMGAKILEVASTTKFSASEVAQGMRTIGQAGFSASEAVETMQAVSDLATGTLSDMSTTVDLVTTAMRVFRIEASESATVSDVFANAVNKSKLTVDKLRTAMNYVGPIARDSGVTFKELAAAMGTLANSGLRASTIGTGLRRVFAELIDPSKKLKAAAREAGVALSELDPRTSSLANVMRNLNLVVNDAQVAFDVFGKRGASAVLALSGTESNFQGMLETISKQGTAAQMAAIQMEGLGVSFKNLKDKLGLLAIALGNAGLGAAMKFLIDISRDLVDALTALVDTAFGKLVVALGLATTAALALSVAMGILQTVMKTTLFVNVAAQVGKFTAGLAAARVAALGLYTALGPIGVALAALIAVVGYFSLAVKDNTQDIQILGDAYGSLAKKFQDYKIKTAGLAKDSKELQDANKELRTSLFDIASKYYELAPAAQAAANSISPLTGEIKKGSTALAEYNKELGKLQLEKLVSASKNINKVFDNQGTAINRWVNEIVSDISNIPRLLDSSWSEVRGISKLSRQANKFAKEIDKGNVSVKEMGEYIAELDHTKLNTQQKVIISNYKLLNEQADKLVKFLRESNTIGLDDTVENIRQIAIDAGITGVTLDNVIDKIKALKESSTGSFENIIEKWSIDGTSAIVDFISEYKKLGGIFKEGEEQQIRENTIRRQSLVEHLEGLKQRQKEEVKAGVSIEKSWKNYYVRERVLLKEAYKLKKELAENNAAQNIIVLQHEQDELAKILAEHAVKYKKNAKLRVKAQEEATREYLRKEKLLLEGQSIDYTDQKADYKAYLGELDKEHAIYLSLLAAQQAKGELTEEGSNAKKLKATVELYRDKLQAAKNFQNQVSEEDNFTEFEKRNKEVLKAEEAFYKSKAKYINTYNKIVYDSNKKIKKFSDDRIDEVEKNAEKNVEIEKDRVSKLLLLESDYKDKIISIHKTKAEKLKAIDKDIAENRKDIANDILGIEQSTEEKIRNIKKKSLSEAGQEASDKQAAYAYLARGLALVAEAQRTADKAALERGTDLIKQSESIGNGLKSERDAINILQDAMAGLKDARDVKGELKELELIQKKEEEIAKAVKKTAEVEKQYKKKVTAATRAIEKIEEREQKRHAKEIKNIDKEIEKLKEKARIAGVRLSDVPTLDTSKEEKERHEKLLKNIEIEGQARKAITSENLRQIQKVADQGYRIIEKDGIKTFTNLSDAQIQMFDDIGDAALEAAQGGFDRLTVTSGESFEAIGENWVDLSKDMGKGIDVKINKLEVPTAKEDIENSILKIDPVEIPATLDLITPEEAGADVYISVDESSLDELYDVKTTLEDVSEGASAEIEVTGVSLVLQQTKSIIDSLADIKDKTITITTKHVSTGSGSAQYAEGGRLPGFGGGDRRPALLEDGEWIINKFAVRKFGDAFMSSINNLRLPKFKDGGKFSISPATSTNAGSMLDSLSNFGTVTLDTGTMQIPAIVSNDVISELNSHLNKLKRFGT